MIWYNDEWLLTGGPNRELYGEVEDRFNAVFNPLLASKKAVGIHHLSPSRHRGLLHTPATVVYDVNR
jgi:hypothetical protein